MKKSYHVEYVSKSKPGVVTESGLTAKAVAQLFECDEIMVIAVWILI